MRLAQKTPMETILWYGTYVQKTCAYVCVEGKSASGVKGHGRMIMVSTFVDLLLFFCGWLYLFCLLYARVFLLLSLTCGLCRVFSKNKKINYCQVKIVHIHMSTLTVYSIFIEQMF